MGGRVWHCVEHPALWVYCGHGALVLLPFLGNFGWAHFGYGMSKAHHLIFRCYIIKGHCDIMCDVTVPHVHWSHDLLLKKVPDALVGVLACCSSVCQV